MPRFPTYEQHIQALRDQVARLTGERDRARDLAVRAGVFDGPRVLTTVAEMDDMPTQTVVLDADGDAWQKVEDPTPGWACATSDMPDTAHVPLHYGGRVTVIHELGGDS